MPVCDMPQCSNEVDGEALLCEQCRLSPIEVTVEARRRALWRTPESDGGPREVDL